MVQTKKTGTGAGRKTLVVGGTNPVVAALAEATHAPLAEDNSLVQDAVENMDPAQQSDVIDEDSGHAKYELEQHDLSGVSQDLEKLALEEPDQVKDPRPLVVVPKAFKLTEANNKVHEFKSGTYHMDEEHATHWFAKANGVYIVE
jgi:hypothetical protein